MARALHHADVSAEACADVLSTLGMEITPLSARTLAVRAVPGTLADGEGGGVPADPSTGGDDRARGREGARVVTEDQFGDGDPGDVPAAGPGGT